MSKSHFYCVFCITRKGEKYLMDFFTKESSAQNYVDSYKRFKSSNTYLIDYLSSDTIKNLIKGGY